MKNWIKIRKLHSFFKNCSNNLKLTKKAKVEYTLLGLKTTLTSNLMQIKMKQAKLETVPNREGCLSEREENL